MKSQECAYGLAGETFFSHRLCTAGFLFLFLRSHFCGKVLPRRTSPGRDLPAVCNARADFFLYRVPNLFRRNQSMPDHKLTPKRTVSQYFNMTVIALSLGFILTAAQAQTVKGIYALPGYNFGAGGVIADSAGNLYGTSQLGGTGNCDHGNGCGAVFELSPTASGWTPA